MNWISPTLYAVGWLLVVLLQAQNSVMSKSNGLVSGWKGMVQWLRGQAINLAFRAFVCGILYGFVIQKIAQQIQGAGLSLHAYAVAGIAGLGASATVYQFFGLFPWLRKEVSDFAPSANDQVTTPPSPPIPPTPPTSETRS